MRDLRLVFRSFRASPGFAVVAILTLATGIGGSTAMFGALRALVMNPLDLPQQERLAQVWSGPGWPLSGPDFLDLHEQSTSFEAFGVYTPGTFNVGAEKARAVLGVQCTEGVLPAFGVAPLQGRWLEAEDAVEGPPQVAVISFGLWQETFAGDPDLVGSKVRINGGDVTVVGIMPAGFEFTGPWLRTETVGVWLPLSLENDESDRGSHWLSGIARLRAGVSVEEADAEIKGIGVRLTELYPDSNTSKRFLVRSLRYEMTHNVGSTLWMLFGAVALVLLVACANVASMMLARSARRQGELGVRVALGATRAALVRPALAESLTLAVLGAVLGLVVAVGGLSMLSSLVPTSEVRRAAMTVNGPVVLFALGAALLTAVLAGLAPALAALRTPVSAVVRDDARGSLGSRSGNRTLRVLVIGQIALAFVLANGAVLFTRAYLRLLDENRALSSEQVLSALLSLRGERYDDDAKRVAAWREIEESLAALPGVTAVGLTSKMPLRGGSNTSGLVNDEVYDPTQQRILIERSSITEDYFETMGLALLQGRNLRPEDDMNEEGVLGVVVNRAMAEKAWPDGDPLGKVIRANTPEPWYTATVVGVVEDVRQWGPEEAVQPEMYTTPPRHWGNQVYVNVRTSGPATAVAPLVRAEIERIDPELALQNVRTLEKLVLDATRGQRAVAGLVDLFMGLALGLVAVGLYGTLSFSVARRTREAGLRIAVGAMRRDIVGMVLGQGMRWVAVGAGLGLVGVFALSGVLSSLVYGMERVTAPPVLLATGALAVAALLACWLPARRAARLDPIVALRSE